MSISGRSSFSCIQTTLASLRGSAATLAAAAALSSGFSTRYLVIFLSILMELMVLAPAALHAASEDFVPVASGAQGKGSNADRPGRLPRPLPRPPPLLRGRGSEEAGGSELAVVTLFESVEQIGG